MNSTAAATAATEKRWGRLRFRCIIPVFFLLYLAVLWVMFTHAHTRIPVALATISSTFLMENTTRTQRTRQSETILISSSSNNNKPDDVPTKSMIQSTHPDFPREPKPRPPLESIVQGWNITGDPSWLLNLAIIGFPKTGTSTLMHYLHISSQIHVFDEERCEMGYNQHVKLIESLHKEIPPGDFIRGIKCPRDLEIPLALKNYETYFPKTDFMVGLRHPIEWFESFYNFRVQNLFPMPPPETLTGRCTKRMNGLCTFRGNFHLFLANLGKTNIANNTQEQELIPEKYRVAIRPRKLKGRVFLWDISQLKNDDHPPHNTTTNTIHDSNMNLYPHSNAQFRVDLQHFLRLEEPLPEMIWVKPGADHKNATILDHVDSKKIDICDFKYFKLRDELLKQGKLAAKWIRDYFLEADGVYVSQKDYFVNVILKSWERDPCMDRKWKGKKKKNPDT